MGIFAGIEDKFLDEQIKDLKKKFKQGMRKGREFTKHMHSNPSKWVSRLKEDVKYLVKGERITNPYGLGYVIASITYIFREEYDSFLSDILANDRDSKDFIELLKKLVDKEGLNMNVLKKRFKRTNERVQKANTRTIHNNSTRDLYISLKEKLPKFIHKL